MSLSTQSNDRQLRSAMSRRTALDLNTASIMRGLVDRSHQAEAQNSAEVIIQKPNWTDTSLNEDDEAGSEKAGGDVAKERTRNADWSDPGEITSTKIVLALNREGEAGRQIDYRDVREAPFAIVEGARSKNAIAIAARIDTDLINHVVTDGGKAANARFGKADGLDRKLAVGADDGDRLTLVQGSDYVKTADSARLVKTALRRGELMFQRRDAFYGEITGGGTIGTLGCLMAPELHSILRLDMEDRNYGYDEITRQLLTQGGVFSNERFQGNIHGFNLFTTNRLSVPSAGQDWKMYLFAQAAVTYAEQAPVTQMLTPETNQTKPATVMRQAVPYGYVTVNEVLLVEVTFATTNS